MDIDLSQDDKIVFMIPIFEKVSFSDDSLCVKCVQSIRLFYPHSKIVIINDSFPEIVHNSSIIDFYKNDHKIEVVSPIIQGSAYFYPINQFYKEEYKNFDYLIVLHDSTVLIKRFPYINYDIKFLWHFTAHFGWDKLKIPYKSDNPKIKTHSDEILELYQKLENSPFKRDFEYFYKNKQLWRGCLGNMFIMSRNFLLYIEQHTKILSLTNFVKTRRDRMCVENIFAMAVFYTKLFNLNDETEYALQGDCCKVFKLDPETKLVGVGEYILKYTYER